jgi:uncharacterized protein YndB with AHSA1/START domain
VPTYTATRKLLAPVEDVWSFVAEPRHLADWWPGVAAVKPDRRGLAPGARWTLHAGMRPSLFRRPEAETTLLVLAVEPRKRLAFQLTRDRIDVELTLADAAEGRTDVDLIVSGPFLVGLRRSLPRNALNRLYALCQTAAEL